MSGRDDRGRRPLARLLDERDRPRGPWHFVDRKRLRICGAMRVYFVARCGERGATGYWHAPLASQMTERDLERPSCLRCLYVLLRMRPADARAYFKLLGAVVALQRKLAAAECSVETLKREVEQGKERVAAHRRAAYARFRAVTR